MVFMLASGRLSASSMYRLGAGTCTGPSPGLGRRTVLGEFIDMRLNVRKGAGLGASSEASKYLNPDQDFQGPYVKSR